MLGGCSLGPYDFPLTQPMSQASGLPPLRAQCRLTPCHCGATRRPVFVGLDGKPQWGEHWVLRSLKVVKLRLPKQQGPG